MSSIKILDTLVSGLVLSHQEFAEKPSKVKGTRLRATLLQIRKHCDVMRKEVLAEVKEIPVKTRAKAPAVSEELPPSPPVLEREATSVVAGIEQPKKIKKKVSKK